MKKNKLILLGGFAGVGKTTMAKKLAKDFNYPFFSSDDFNEGLRPLLKKSFSETSPYAYGILFYILEKNLEFGVTCVLDLNMCHEQTWKTIDRMKKELATVEIVPIILECSFEEHKRRIDKRERENKGYLNMGGGKLEDVLYKYEFITNLKRKDIIRIDANKSTEDVYREIVKVIE